METKNSFRLLSTDAKRLTAQESAAFTIKTIVCTLRTPNYDGCGLETLQMGAR